MIYQVLLVAAIILVPIALMAIFAARKRYFEEDREL